MAPHSPRERHLFPVHPGNALIPRDTGGREYSTPKSRPKYLREKTPKREKPRKKGRKKVPKSPMGAPISERKSNLKE